MDLPIIISKLFISINIYNILPISRNALLPKIGTGNNITFYKDLDSERREHSTFIYIITCADFIFSMRKQIKNLDPIINFKGGFW